MTLINNGADSEAKDYSDTTPYGYAIKNNHEDLCIFLIQNENIADIPINEVVDNEEHEVHKLTKYKRCINSHEYYEMMDKKKELEKLSRIDQINEGFKKLKTYSPFYYAITHNMQGNMYLLIQRGYDQFAALSEAIIHNKFNFFISLLDSIDESKLKNKTDEDGKNLMHILAEHTKESSVDLELMNEVYNLIVSFKIDIEAKDLDGRLPLHYALKSQNIKIAKKLLSNKTTKQVVKLCNTLDDARDKSPSSCDSSAFSMLFYNVVNKSTDCYDSPLVQEAIDLFGTNIKEMIPFVNVEDPNYQIQHQIHPLIVLIEKLGVDACSVDAESFDLVNMRSPDESYNFIDFCFRLGKISVLKHKFFNSILADYLKPKKNIEWVEGILAEPLRKDAFVNTERIVQFIEEEFNTRLEVNLNHDVRDHQMFFADEPKISYDYEEDSELVLKRSKNIPGNIFKNISDKDKDICKVDSNQNTEKHCVVVKDELETGFYFDACMKKVDIKKYYYGLDNFYVMQIFKDEVKNLYILWTRWGRSGSYGQYQRTPFGTLESAKEEFDRVFKQKTGWKWKDLENYSKLPKKYELKRIGGKLLSKSHSKLKFSDKDFDFEKLIISIDDIDGMAKPKCDEGLIEFFKPLVTDNQLYNNLKNSQFSSSLFLESSSKYFS